LLKAGTPKDAYRAFLGSKQDKTTWSRYIVEQL